MAPDKVTHRAWRVGKTGLWVGEKVAQPPFRGRFLWLMQKYGDHFFDRLYIAGTQAKTRKRSLFLIEGITDILCLPAATFPFKVGL